MEGRSSCAKYSVLMAESEEQGGGGATTDPRLDAINDYTLKTLKVSVSKENVLDNH